MMDEFLSGVHLVAGVVQVHRFSEWGAAAPRGGHQGAPWGPVGKESKEKRSAV